MNIISNLFTVGKLSKQIKKEFQHATCFDNSQSAIDSFNKSLVIALKLIADSELDKDFKKTYRTQYLGSLLLELKDKMPTKSGNEIYKLFGWDQDIYKEMLRGAHP